jgi:peptide/nickel transport system substrate-binding protein
MRLAFPVRPRKRWSRRRKGNMDAAGDRGSAGLTRRQVLAGVAALAMPTTASAAPACGGVLRMALSGGETSAAVLASARHGYLTAIGADGTVRSGLAESWETDDAQRWQFRLRRGITFHSGRDVTAQDVKTALMRHGAERPAVIGDIAAAHAAGDMVTVLLDRPDAGFA